MEPNSKSTEGGSEDSKSKSSETSMSISQAPKRDSKSETSQLKSASKASMSKQQTESQGAQSSKTGISSSKLSVSKLESTTSTSSGTSQSESISKAPSTSQSVLGSKSKAPDTKTSSSIAEASKSKNAQPPEKPEPKSQFQVALAGPLQPSSTSIKKKSKHKRSVRSKHKRSRSKKGRKGIKKKSLAKSSQEDGYEAGNSSEDGSGVGKTKDSTGGFVEQVKVNEGDIQVQLLGQVAPQSTDKASKKKRKSPTLIDKVKITGILPTSDDFDEISDYDFNGNLYLISQFLAFILMALLNCWLIEYYEGFHPGSIINIHPLLMVFTLIYVLANSLLLLNAKKKLQGARLILLGTISVLTITGLAITIVWHFIQKLSHFQSLHSWIGIITLIIVLIYLLYTHYVYFKTDFQQGLKQIYYLRLLGICALIMAGATSLLGISELLMMKMFVKSNAQFKFVSHENDNTPVPNMLANTIGLFTICYILSMIYLLTTTNYKPKQQRKRELIERQIRTSLHRAMAQLQQQERKHGFNI